MPKRYISNRISYGVSAKRFKKATRIPWRKAPLRKAAWGAKAQELKVVDVFQNDIPLVNAGTVTLLNGMAQGVDYFQRVGRKALLKSIMVKGAVTVEQTGSGGTLPLQSMSCRVAIVHDSQANGSLPSFADIFASVDNIGTVTNTSFSGVNLTNRDRFRILKDWTFELRPNMAYTAGAIIGATAASPGQHGTKNLKWYSKMDQEMIFGGIDQDISSIQTGSILLVVQSDNGGTVPNSADPYYDGCVRIRFVDP